MNDRIKRLINLGTTILYHQTTRENATKLLNTKIFNDPMLGKAGIVGYGIYFAGIPQDTVGLGKGKGGVILEVEVYLGKMYTIENWSQPTKEELRKFKNFKNLRFEDVIKYADSIYVKNINDSSISLFGHEYIVYNQDQIKNIREWGTIN
jgi:hypothetical protein